MLFCDLWIYCLLQPFVYSGTSSTHLDSIPDYHHLQVPKTALHAWRWALILKSSFCAGNRTDSTLLFKKCTRSQKHLQDQEAECPMERKSRVRTMLHLLALHPTGDPHHLLHVMLQLQPAVLTSQTQTTATETTMEKWSQHG